MKKYLVLTKNPNMQIRTWADLERHIVQDVVYNYLKEEEVDEAELRKILMHACFVQYEDEFEDQFGINPMACDLEQLWDAVKDNPDENLIGVIDLQSEKSLYFNPELNTEFGLFDGLDDETFTYTVLDHDAESLVSYMLLEDGAEYDIKECLQENFKHNINQLPNSGVTEKGKKELLDILLYIIDKYDYFHWENNDELTFSDIKAFADNPYEAQKGYAFEDYMSNYDINYGKMCLDLHNIDGDGACLLSWFLYFLYKEPVSEFLENIHDWEDVPGYLYDDTTYSFETEIPALIYLYDEQLIDIPEAKLEEFGDYPWERE